MKISQEGFCWMIFYDFLKRPDSAKMHRIASINFWWWSTIENKNLHVVYRILSWPKWSQRQTPSRSLKFRRCSGKHQCCAETDWGRAPLTPWTNSSNLRHCHEIKTDDPGLWTGCQKGVCPLDPTKFERWAKTGSCRLVQENTFQIKQRCFKSRVRHYNRWRDLNIFVWAENKTTYVLFGCFKMNQNQQKWSARETFRRKWLLVSLVPLDMLQLWL